MTLTLTFGVKRLYLACRLIYIFILQIYKESKNLITTLHNINNTMSERKRFSYNFKIIYINLESIKWLFDFSIRINNHLISKNEL